MWGLGLKRLEGLGVKAKGSDDTASQVQQLLKENYPLPGDKTPPGLRWLLTFRGLGVLNYV